MTDKKTPPPLNKYAYRLRNIRSGEEWEIKEVLPYIKKVVAKSKGLGGHGETRTQRGYLKVVLDAPDMNPRAGQVTKNSRIGNAILKMERNGSDSSYLTYKTAGGKEITCEILEKSEI